MSPRPLLALCLLACSPMMGAEPLQTDDSAPTEFAGVVNEGKVAFKLSRHIYWTGKPAYPLTVKLLDQKRFPVASITVTEGATVDFPVSVSAGKYTIFSSIPEESGYWGSYGGLVEVSDSGEVSIQPQRIEHCLKITLIAPAQMERIEGPRPTLLWAPLEGTKFYTIRWFEKDPVSRKTLREKQHIKVEGSPVWTFDTDVVPLRVYEWQVDAYDDAGARIGYFASGYFRTD